MNCNFDRGYSSCERISATAMADGAFRVLYYIVGGEKAVFKASVDDDITDLKMCIFQH